jgi:hypothetical protein
MSVITMPASGDGEGSVEGDGDSEAEGEASSDGDGDASGVLPAHPATVKTSRRARSSVASGLVFILYSPFLTENE